MRTIVFRTNIDILFLRLRIIRYFPQSPISTFRTSIPQKQKRNAVAPPSLPLPLPHRWEKRQCNVFIVFPQDLGKSYFFTCAILLRWFGVVRLFQEGIIDGSFRCLKCCLDLGRFELGVISANIWFSWKLVPMRITKYFEKLLFFALHIFGSSCDSRYLLCLFLPVHGLQTHLYHLDSFALKNITMKCRYEKLFLSGAKYIHLLWTVCNSRFSFLIEVIILYIYLLRFHQPYPIL